jgi:hypothetical protein
MTYDEGIRRQAYVRCVLMNETPRDVANALEIHPRTIRRWEREPWWRPTAVSRGYVSSVQRRLRQDGLPSDSLSVLAELKCVDDLWDVVVSAFNLLEAAIAAEAEKPWASDWYSPVHRVLDDIAELGQERAARESA